ncbi:O-6-methylguanine DNA methyltransferase [Chitinophaga dinghuensis]|uniref:O-6-methylguanine DNA methyltransferase n=1 Tax=Chitinophaga dinghuensis TaxID=1539050 RepID=A0A327VZ29_9BACT|nr:methylated-DNA--[protein]-cysteine S-methyltransferase [Chitinophaga dinghuensis]RAJ80400.1 O-6-methylguanine DNA methyltransferase [Chitinophaga dinghuensis]
MKNRTTNSQHAFIQTVMFPEDYKTNVKDKNEMRHRLHNTQLTKPDNIKIEAWMPGDEDQTITYERAVSLFGDILVASTSKGLCYLGFDFSDRISALEDLKRRFPRNPLIEKAAPFHEAALQSMNNPQLQLPLQLHLKGTKFQLEIWEKLSHIPFGGFTTYGQIGGSNKNARATGTAVGSNPISYLLPCHRVIHTDGGFNGYFWGTEVKEKILAWETSKITL